MTDVDLDAMASLPTSHRKTRMLALEQRVRRRGFRRSSSLHLMSPISCRGEMVAAAPTSRKARDPKRSLGGADEREGAVREHSLLAPSDPASSDPPHARSGRSPPPPQGAREGTNTILTVGD